ncbi:MAG: serine/threonine protein kinase [Verrucomicrobia bacterium]|nr:serine/threonine protein kinase [Verrucomicrobiota bacterium]MCH8512585.1 serine/threonine protein kinase [Kiritimatiellia bacterium]
MDNTEHIQDPDETRTLLESKMAPPRSGETTLTVAGKRDADQYTRVIPYGVQRERERLIENFEQVINEQVIYFPVCYRFAEEIGRGRQGIVYMANRQGGRGCLTRHAIKVFDPGIYSTPAMYWTDMGRIASQISVMQRLRSPNLVSMETYDEVNGIGYLQMELINGVDLRYLLTGKRMEQVGSMMDPEEWSHMRESIFRLEEDHIAIQPGVAIYLMRMMLKGLEALHEAGFIHSDMKPSNVMVDQFGYVKVIDYGRAVKPREKVSVLLGSPLYMAPENHRREPATEQSDIYGVGMVGLELLRGRPLVDARSMTEEDLYHFKMDLPNHLYDLLPQHVRENNEFVRVLSKFVDPDPEKRYANVVAAETEQEGLRIVHKQLIALGKDVDYSRVMAGYMSRLCRLRRGEVLI